MTSPIQPGAKFANANNGKTDEVIRSLPGGRIEMGRRLAQDDPRLVRQWSTTVRSVRAMLDAGTYTAA